MPIEIDKHDTKSLLDVYFKTRPESTSIKIRGQIDRPELYEFEKKSGKTLVEMDSKEIAEVLHSFNNKGITSNVYRMSYRTYDTLLSIIRDFFNWYIDNVEIIKNPCNDKKIKGRNAMLLFEDDTKPFTKLDMENAIKELRNSQVDEYADYEEAIIRMFYEGFPESIDIVNMKESEINHAEKSVLVRNKKIFFSDRLYELLEKVNNMESLPAHRGYYLMLSYNGSYFKFPTREKYKKEFSGRPPEYWAGHISRIFNRDIKVKLDININARTLYLLGFYDYLVENLGKEKTKQIIMSIRSPEDTKTLMDYAEKYGVIEQNVTTLKKLLLPFVSK